MPKKALSRKKKTAEKLLFIDTSIFHYTVQSEISSHCFKSIKDILQGQMARLILPEVIQKETSEKIINFRNNLLKIAEENLSTEKILGQPGKLPPEGQTKENEKKSKAKPDEYSASVIDELISLDRKKLISRISTFYDSLFKDIEIIFSHKQTKVIKLTDNMLVRGLKRAALKKAPYSRKDTVYSKDIDCIAFESLLSHLKKEGKAKKEVIMCVSDTDYYSESGGINREISSDLKSHDLRCYKRLTDMLKSEFNIEISSAAEKAKTDESKASLADPSGTVEQSLLIAKINPIDAPTL